MGYFPVLNTPNISNVTSANPSIKMIKQGMKPGLVRADLTFLEPAGLYRAN
jgi:hypothetical protein